MGIGAVALGMGDAGWKGVDSGLWETSGTGVVIGPGEGLSKTRDEVGDEVKAGKLHAKLASRMAIGTIQNLKAFWCSI